MRIKTAGTDPWHSSSGGEEWITFEFPENTTLQGFRTKAHSGWGGSHFKDFRFEYASGSDDWHTFYTGQGSNLDCCEWETIVFDTNSPATQKFRLFMINTWGYPYLTLEQLQLYYSCETGTSDDISLFSVLLHNYTKYDQICLK